MRQLLLFCGVLAAMSGIENARAESSVPLAQKSSLVLDSALGFTSNANLVQDAPQSDRILKVGGALRFPLAETRGRFSLRYTDYGKMSENDLLSADLSSSWDEAVKAGTGKTYDLRVFHRQYVKQSAGTTDQGFTHYGAAASMMWAPSPGSPWRIGPRGEIRNFTSGSRTDFDLSFPIEREMDLSSRPGSTLSFSAAPGLLVSTAGDFSKAYLALTADYEAPLPGSLFGAYLALTPSWYLSRSTSATVLSGNGRRASTVTVVSKESTTFLSPGVWWSKPLTPDWEFRAETFLNLQSSKSGTFSYTELQALASIRYRAF
jgi:hypothetical protein